MQCDDCDQLIKGEPKVAIVNGQKFNFCSDECRDGFAKFARRQGNLGGAVVYPELHPELKEAA